MPNLIIGSDRQFQLWKYTVGHKQLLLRSVKSSAYPTRIDVLFKGVSQFHLPTVLNGLFITEAAEIEIPGIFTLQESAALKKEIKVFPVKGRDFVGYVSALAVFTHEDEAAYHSPSFFPSLEGP